jgi:unsaturated chondroitin disaccharide hydrolase
MMNIPLLFFAFEETGYRRYKEVAIAHADKTLENFIRSDGSVDHIVVYDQETGEKLESLGGQGYGVGSSWSRGQSWAINGFAQAYKHTNDQRYLDAAKKVAHYFIACISDTEYIPLVDFRSPKEPMYIDTTAGAIAASGLIDIAQMVSIQEKDLYLNAATNILKALVDKELDLTLDTDNLLRNGSESYWGNKHMSIIYGDYYLMEAVLKLRKEVQK